MANLPETPVWETGIYQLEETDPVQGGPNGIDNQQGKQLANRTAWLKAQVDTLGTGKQPLDATLSALAALSGIADHLIYFTGPDAVALAPLSAFIRGLLENGDASSARATLGAISQAQLDAAIAALVSSSPATLDTLNELAAALGNDANFATTISNTLALKASTQSIQKAEATISPSGGTADAITAGYTPSIAKLSHGMTLKVRAGSANATSTPTFTPNSSAIPAKTIVKGAGAALLAGDIAGPGHWIEMQYDSALDKWVLLNPATGIVSGGVQVNANNNWKKAQRGAIAALAYAATITIDFNTSNNFTSTLTGNATLANPLNLVEGQSGIITLKQDANGSRTLAYGSAWKFIGGVVPSLSAAANAVDELVYYVNPGAATVFAILNKDVR